MSEPPKCWICEGGEFQRLQDENEQLRNAPCFDCVGSQAEIDRLRAELATWKKAHIELGEMYDRLRAENAELHEQLDTVSEAHNVMAKEGDSLRAENAMARVFFQAILDSGQRGYPADLAIEFLAKTAKTAKEGE